MNFVAESKNVKISPRKVRLVADGIRRMPIDEALVALSVMAKRAAIPMRKALVSAVANATNGSKAKKEDLVIAEIIVNEGISYKRFHFAGRGRSRPYKKRTSHIRVVLENKMVKDEKKVVAQPVQKEEKKALEAPKKKEVKAQKSKVKETAKKSKV